ncbi:hypothetical protein DV738_g1845, partial [Chaetothyriales sp. CBS 135597]
MADTSTPEAVLGPRPFNLTGTDQRGAVMTISILFIVYAFLIVGMRLATKYRSMGLDDWLAISAMVLGLPQPISNIVAVRNGFGAPYNISSQTQLDTIASVPRWAVVGAIDGFTEVAIYGVSVLAVLPLQMNWTRKFQASVCFALRIPIIIFITLHLKFLSDFNSAKNPSVALTKVQIFRECEIIYSLLSASIPALNQYLRKFNTQEATQFGFNPTRYANSGGSGRRGLPLKSFTKSKTKGTQNASWNASSNDNIIPNHNKSTSYKALVNAQNGTTPDAMSNGSREDVSFGRHDSEDYIIRKDVHYEVRHEN